MMLCPKGNNGAQSAAKAGPFAYHGILVQASTDLGWRQSSAGRRDPSNIPRIAQFPAKGASNQTGNQQKGRREAGLSEKRICAFSSGQ